MPTITESLQNATAAMGAATAGLLTATQKIELVAAQKQTQAETAITNFIAAGVTNHFIDPAGSMGGDDANDGKSANKPFRTLDKALDTIEASGTSLYGAVIFVLSDGAVLNRYRSMSAPLAIIGAAWGGGELGAFYRLVLRTLTLQGEALNSPVAGSGRTIAGLRFNAQIMRLQSLAIQLPDTPAGLNQVAVINMINGGSVIVEGCIFTAASAGTLAKVFTASAPASFSISGTVSTNMAGKLFAGVVAGADPNANFAYRSNITSN